jgi:DNA repair protein RadD
MAFELRSYQVQSVMDVREAFKSNDKVVLVSPTGSGKTVMFCHIVEAAENKGKSVTVLVHREELVTQSSLSLAENGIYHRLISPAKVQRDIMKDHVSRFGKSLLHPATDVVVASVQTLVRNFGKLPPMDLIINDECHHTVPDSNWGKIITQYPKAKVLGVTATPERLDGRGLDNVFQKLIQGVSTKWLIDNGYLCVPKVYTHPSTVRAEELVEGVHSQFGDYKKKELESKMSRSFVVGDAVEHYRALCPNVPAIAFCVTVRHAEQVAQHFCDAGFRAIALDGTTDKNIRKSALKALGRGEIDIVTSCDLISEGVDVPLVGAAILLRPTQSLALYLQQVGRCLRPYPMHLPVMQKPHMQKLIGDDGKHIAFILDHAGNTLRHGLPQAERNWVLTTDKKKKKRKPPEMHNCPKCDFLHEIGPDECPSCHFSYVRKRNPSDGLLDNTMQVIEGNLVEISDIPDWTGGLSLSRSPLKQLVARAYAESHFNDIAMARGYKKGWAFFAMKEKRGE